MLLTCELHMRVIYKRTVRVCSASLLIRRGCQKKNSSTILISGEELSSCKEKVVLQFKGIKLDKKDFFGKSDPFLLIKRSCENTELALFTIASTRDVMCL